MIYSPFPAFFTFFASNLIRLKWLSNAVFLFRATSLSTPLGLTVDKTQQPTLDQVVVLLGFREFAINAITLLQLSCKLLAIIVFFDIELEL